MVQKTIINFAQAVLVTLSKKPKGNPMKTIFISYSHKDEFWKNQFKPQVSLLEKAGLDIVVWDDRKIDVGDTWYPEITQAMEQAAVAVCLISENFLNSDFCVKEEVPFLLKKREQAGMLFIPVLIHSCFWEAFTWLKSIQMFPRDGKSIAEDHKDDYKHIFKEIAKTIYERLPNLRPKTPSLQISPTRKMRSNPHASHRRRTLWPCQRIGNPRYRLGIQSNTCDQFCGLGWGWEIHFD
jgi:hypothetical protein